MLLIRFVDHVRILQAKMQKFPPLITEMCGEVMQEYGFGDQDIMRGIIEIQVGLWLSKVLVTSSQ